MSTAPTVSLDQILAYPNLPTLPSVALEILELTSKPNVNLDQIAEAVQNDQALCAKILKTVNSSFYGLTTPCATITRAIGHLGLSTVKSLVLGFSLVDCTRATKEGFDLIAYWRRCIYSAAATRSIALKTQICDPEEAFVAALMQDIGVLAMFYAIGREYGTFIREVKVSHDRLAELEQRAFGFHHAKVGAMLAQRWRLPGEMIEAIGHHHDPEHGPAHNKLVKAVALGLQASETLSIADSSAALATFRTRAEQWFTMDADDADSLLIEVSTQAKSLARLFQINVGSGFPDINDILARAQEAALQHQFMVQRETQQLRESNSNLARLAMTDALTGVGNRKQFDAEMPRLFSMAHSMGGCLAIVMVDVDHFKRLNDTYGHQVGDLMLVELARRIHEIVPPPGMVCRYGGEEFVAILPGLDRKGAARLAEQMRLAICGTPIDVSGLHGPVQAVPMTASLGVAALEPAVAARLNSAQMLVRAADRALYAAKGSGRNCVRVFTLQPTAAAA